MDNVCGKKILEKILLSYLANVCLLYMFYFKMSCVYCC